MGKPLLELLRGITAINVTPFSDNDGIDYRGLEQNLDFLVEGGLELIVPCGNTGEFYSLAPKEAWEVVERTARHLAGRATALAGIGHSLGTAIGMADQAQKAGCAGVMVHQPAHPFVTDAGYVEYIRRISEATDLPVVPYLRAASLSQEAILEVAAMPGVCGVKFAFNDLQRLADVVTRTPAQSQITWVCGTAESWAPFFYAAGARGFTSGLVNVFPGLSRRLLVALDAGDQVAARRVWKLIKPFEELRARGANAYNVSVVKEAMQQLRLGSRRVRAPISELPDAMRAELAQILPGLKAAQDSLREAA